jgi:hypothetical protein
MATYVTFSTLIADLQNYLERGGSVITDETVFNQLPRLINAAERKIIQVLKLQGSLENLNDTMQVGVPVIAKPDRWRQTVSINYGSGPNLNSRTPLFPRGYEYCRAYASDDTALAPPVFYADYNLLNWLIAPTPDMAYPFEANCYMQPPLLDSTNQTNFFSQYTPNMLLYGSLLEASAFLKDDGRVQVWKDLYQFEIETLVPQDLQKILDRAAERSKP